MTKPLLDDLLKLKGASWDEVKARLLARYR
jgi:hypothetical protein